jgi:CTP:phosphocholine cytidylyltransferase-like protein
MNVSKLRKFHRLSKPTYVLKSDLKNLFEKKIRQKYLFSVAHKKYRNKFTKATLQKAYIICRL